MHKTKLLKVFITFYSITVRKLHTRAHTHIEVNFARVRKFAKLRFEITKLYAFILSPGGWRRVGVQLVSRRIYVDCTVCNWLPMSALSLSLSLLSAHPANCQAFHLSRNTHSPSIIASPSQPLFTIWPQIFSSIDIHMFVRSQWRFSHLFLALWAWRSGDNLLAKTVAYFFGRAGRQTGNKRKQRVQQCFRPVQV